VHCFVVDVDGSRSTHLQRSLDRISGVVRAQGDGNDLNVVALVGDPQGLLHRILVELGQQTIGARSVQRAVVGEPAVSRGIRDVLHQHQDLHLPPTLLETWAHITHE
jgi:hypothetical protein